MKYGYIYIDRDSKNIDFQIKALNEYGVDEIYEEIGSKSKRHQLIELLKKLKAGDTLVIWQFNVLGRTIKQFLPLMQDFEKMGIKFVSLMENFDTSTSIGKDIVLKFKAILQMERDVISERTNTGLESTKKKSGRRPKDDISIEKALKMYFSNEYSIIEIVEETGLSKTCKRIQCSLRVKKIKCGYENLILESTIVITEEYKIYKNDRTSDRPVTTNYMLK